MYRVVICEDTQQDLEGILSLLAQYQKERDGLVFTVSHYSSAEELLAGEDSAEAELYLLDAILPGMNGVEVARALRGRGSRAQILFLTASRDFAVEAFTVRAANYLLKPIESDSLFPALDEITAHAIPRQREYCVIPASVGEIHVPTAKIVCVELVQRVPHYHLEDGAVIMGKYIRASFMNAIPKELRRAEFLQPHQSILINMNFVAQMRREEFVLKNNMRVPISRLRRAEVCARYLEFLRRQMEEGVD